MLHACIVDFHQDVTKAFRRDLTFLRLQVFELPLVSWTPG